MRDYAGTGAEWLDTNNMRNWDSWYRVKSRPEAVHRLEYNDIHRPGKTCKVTMKALRDICNVGGCAGPALITATHWQHRLPPRAAWFCHQHVPPLAGAHLVALGCIGCILVHPKNGRIA